MLEGWRRICVIHITCIVIVRCYYSRRSFWNADEKGKKNKFTSILIGKHKNRRLSFLPQAGSALATTRNLDHPNFYQEVCVSNDAHLFLSELFV